MMVSMVAVRVSGRGSVLEDGEDEADLLTTPLHVSAQTLVFEHWSVMHKVDITNKTCEDLDVRIGEARVGRMRWSGDCIMSEVSASCVIVVKILII